MFASRIGRTSHVPFRAALSRICFSAMIMTTPMVRAVRAQGVSAAMIRFGDPVACNGQRADDIAAAYYESAEKAAEKFAAALRTCWKDGSINTANRYYLVSLITTVGSTALASGAVQPQVLHFVVHDGWVDYRLILPGLPEDTKVSAVVMYSGSTLAFVSTAAETRVPSALTTNAGAFFQQVNPGTFWINAIRAAPAIAGRTEAASMYAQIGDLPLRYSSASIVITEMASLAPLDNLTKDDIAPLSKALMADSVKYHAYGASSKTCAEQLSDTVYKTLGAIIRVNEPWKTLSNAVPTSVAQFDYHSCQPGHPLRFSEAQAVLSDYAGAVAAPAPSQITSSATVANAPRVRFQFTAAVAALVGNLQGGQQVSANSSNTAYQASPLNRGMTMAAVAFHPVSFDSTTTCMTAAERFSLLGGFVLTPTGGLGLGASVGIIRGLSVNAGTAWLVVSKGPAGQAPGAPLPTTGNIIVTGVSRSWFIGGNYVFGK